VRSAWSRDILKASMQQSTGQRDESPCQEPSGTHQKLYRLGSLVPY
jgi:hypothetical protein